MTLALAASSAIGCGVFESATGTDVMRLQMAEIATAVDAYRTMHKRLPPDLAFLTQTRDGGDKPLLSALPSDAWGRAYDFHDLSNGKYRLRSAGADGILDTGDDIVHVPTPPR